MDPDRVDFDDIRRAPTETGRRNEPWSQERNQSWFRNNIFNRGEIKDSVLDDFGVGWTVKDQSIYINDRKLTDLEKKLLLDLSKESSKDEYPRRGKTRIPKKLVHTKALFDLGYPFYEEVSTCNFL